MAIKHEGRSIRMTMRRSWRLLAVFLAVLCVLLVLRSPTVVILPLVGGSSRNTNTNTSTLPPISSGRPPVSRIAKATVATNTLNNSIINQALRSHTVQNEMHGYVHHITNQELVSDLSEHDSKHRPRGAWSKPAYLLALIVAELAKPESERLEWLFWFDADTIVMNPHTPLEIFLPPNSVPQLENINLLMAKNMDGLNSGVFALRVHPWSVSILSTILAYPIYEADRSNTDRFRDQSAFQWLLQPNQKSPLFKAPYQGREYWAEVPMRWFNSLPFNNAFSKKWDWIFNYNMTTELFDNGTSKVFEDGHGGVVRPWKVMQGDMIVHFAGADPVRQSWMGGWLERLEQYLPEWSNATKQVDLKAEAAGFWQGVVARIDRQREANKSRPAPPPLKEEEKEKEKEKGNATEEDKAKTEKTPEKLLVDTRYGDVPAVSKGGLV